jgi:streptogrisin C
MNAMSMRVLVAAGATAMSFGSLTGSAAAADAGASPFEAAVAAYKSAYPQLSDARARANAAGADARRAVYDAAAADAATFGGAWFDPQTGAVNVAGTTAAANGRAVALGKQYGVAVTAVKVKRSAAALETQAARLRSGTDELGRTAKGQVGIDVTTNTVTVAVPRERKAALAGSAAASGAKLVEDPGTQVVADAGCTTRSACDWTIRAGAVIWRGTTASNTPWCSVGFTARNANNTRFVYTAGHCSTGIGVNWGTGAQNIGPLTAAMDSGAVDASVIQVTNGWFTGDSGGEIYTSNASHTAPVVGVAPTVTYMVAGETVCLSANFTSPAGDNMCGVLGTNSDAAVRGMARVDGLDACGGDSGGGWYWYSSTGNRYAYGIHSRSDNGCHGDAGGTHSWFGAIATAKSSFQPTLNVETRPA